MSAQPQKTPIVQKPSPVVVDQLIVETEDSNQPGSFDRFLEYGHFHGDTVKYPNHRLLKQGPNAYGVYQRTWGTSPVLQDTYNAEKIYAEDSNEHPTFTRSYRVLRSDYLVDGPATKSLPFTGIVAVKVTAPGTGYTQDFAVSFTGGDGSGATGLAIVNGLGGVDRVEIMAIGSGYTSAPTAVFTAGSGTGAAGTVAIQPASAVLMSEKHSKLPPDDPYASLFDYVVRVYETIPGKVVEISDEIDTKSGMRVLRTRQKKFITDITEGVTRDDGNDFVTIITSDGIDGDTANEIKTTIYKSPHFDEATAKIESGNRQTVFPGYILSYGEYGGVTITAIDLFGADVGVKAGVSSDVECTLKTYYVIAATKPVVAYDQIIYGSAYISGKTYNRVLFDDLTRGWGSYGAYTQPGTTPTATEYRGAAGAITSGDPPPDPFAPGTGTKWVGTYKKPEAPEITHYLAPNYIWQVRETLILMRDSADDL